MHLLPLLLAPLAHATLPADEAAELRGWLYDDGLVCGAARVQAQATFGVTCPPVAFATPAPLCYVRLSRACEDACTPTAEIPYDGIDQDCDGADLVDVDGDGYAATAAGGGDCDDTAGDVNPGAADVCGPGGDRSCDGVVACAVFDDGVHYEGDLRGGSAGFTVAGGSDLDGDGQPDLLIGAPRSSNLSGVVYVVPQAIMADTPLSTTATQIRGEHRDDELGYVLAAGADLDGDGAADFALGAPYSSAYAPNGGTAWLFAGPQVGAFTVSDASGAVYGPNGQLAPRSLAMGPDATGDGLDDVAVGTARTSTTGGAGTAGIVGAGPWATRSSADLEFLVTGRSAADLSLGRAVLLPGDLDGDGLADFATSMVPEGYAGTSEVCLFAGPLSGAATLDDCDARWIGSGSVGYALGATLVAGEDVDGDGLGDLLVGSWLEGRAGSVLLFTDPLGRDGTSADAWATVTGGADGLVGFDMATADLDGDGAVDLVVPDAYAEVEERRDGAVYLFPSIVAGSYTPEDAAVMFWRGERETSFGIAVDTPGDADGDGCVDLVVGENNANTSAYQGGFVTVLSGCDRW